MDRQAGTVDGGVTRIYIHSPYRRVPAYSAHEIKKTAAYSAAAVYLSKPAATPRLINFLAETQPRAVAENNRCRIGTFSWLFFFPFQLTALREDSAPSGRESRASLNNLQ